MCLMAGIRDIAEKCGVSAGAVSRILNGDPSFSVTQQVREAVEKEAERLGYKTPRQRRNDNPHIILMLAPIDKPGFESELFSMLQPMARQAGFELSLADCHGRADGLIALGEFTPEEIGCFQSMAEHLLFINNLGFDFSYDSIKVDYRYAEEQVIDFFLSNIFSIPMEMAHRDKSYQLKSNCHLDVSNMRVILRPDRVYQQIKQVILQLNRF